MELEHLLQELADASRPIRHLGLTAFSGVAGEEVQALKDGWPKLAAPRRAEVVSKLLDLAEDNPELNFDTLFVFCLKDQDEHVRERAIAGLWECEEREVLTSLMELLRCDPADGVRAAAAQALGKFLDLCQANKFPARNEARIQEVLLAATTSPTESAEVRRRALEASASLQLPQLKRLIQEAYASNNPRLRASAVYAMGRNGDTGWLPTIVKELGSNSAEMRCEAAAACGMLGAAGTLPKLLPLLRDDDLQVRFATIVALGALGGPAAKKALQAELRSPDEAIREAAEQALGELEFQEDPLSFRPQL